jgi:hypothetical protein
MLSGIFWLDDGTGRGLEQAVARAADSYRSRFHREPTLCLVPPGMLHEGRTRLRGLAIREHSTLPPRHLWIGIDDAHEPLHTALTVRDPSAAAFKSHALRSTPVMAFRRRASRTTLHRR